MDLKLNMPIDKIDQNLIKPVRTSLQNQPIRTTAQNEARARETAQEFESFFIYQTLDLMKPETPEEQGFGGGFAEDMFRDILNENVADAIAESGGFGISDMIYKQLIKYQEVK